MWTCSKCETHNDDNAQICTLCRQTRPVAEPLPAPPMPHVPPPPTPYLPRYDHPLESGVYNMKKLRVLMVTPIVMQLVMNMYAFYVLSPEGFIIVYSLVNGISMFITCALFNKNRNLPVARWNSWLGGIFMMLYTGSIMGGFYYGTLSGQTAKVLTFIILLEMMFVAQPLIRIITFVSNARKVKSSSSKH